MNQLDIAKTEKEKNDIKEVIDETFALVLSYDKTGDWK